MLELVDDFWRMETKTVVSEAKAAAALKSHSEAERRRRERINAHLDTLRGLVPSNEKMDKATLLAQVVSELKRLKKTTTQATKGLHIPSYTDEVQVDTDGPFLLRASLCCEYRPGLVSNVRRAISDDLIHAQLLKCEVSTLGGRVKIVFLISAGGEGNAEVISSSVRAALSDVLDKVSASAEYDEQLFSPQNRRRFSCSES